MRTNNILYNNIIHAVQQTDFAANIFLFGSRAKNQANKESDWDFLILSSKENLTKYDERKVKEAIYMVELEMNEPISTLIIPKNKWNTLYRNTPLYNNIVGNAIQLL